MIVNQAWAGAAALFVALTAAPAFAGAADPSDPLAPVPSVPYRAVLGDYRAPVNMDKPGDWRELNRRAEQIGGPGGQLRGPDEPIRRRRQ